MIVHRKQNAFHDLRSIRAKLFEAVSQREKQDMDLHIPARLGNCILKIDRFLADEM